MAHYYSYLFVPAPKADAFLSKLTSDCNLPHCVIFDLEDSVAEKFKESARLSLRKAIDEHHQTNAGLFNWYIRINRYSSPFFYDDMELMRGLRQKQIGIMLPKCGNCEDLKSVEEFHGPLAPTMPTIETIEGFENRNDILHLSRTIGVRTIAFGAGDMSLDLGIERNYALPVLKHILCALLVSTKHYQLDLIDSPSRVLPVEGSDWEQRVAEECAFASDNGFSGKMAIHPSQVQIIEQVFNPESKIEWARKVSADFEKNTQTQAIRSSDTGNYIGTPVLRYAKSILQSRKPREK